MWFDRPFILVVGNKPIGSALVDSLKRLGYPVTHPAQDDDPAEAVARSAECDLVLLVFSPEDKNYAIWMPLLAQKTAPVVVISSQPGVISACLSLGADDYCLEPVDPALLISRIQRCLELKRLRRLVEATGEDKNRFVSLISHEVKTPLTSIKGYADLLLAGLSDQNQKPQVLLDYLKVIRANVDTMSGIISDMADIAKAEAGQLYRQPVPVFLGEVAAEALFQQKKVDSTLPTIHTHLPASLPPVWADHRHMLMVMSRLLDNACRHTPIDGVITIRAELTAPPDRPEMIHVTVQDSGVGISPEVQEKIFEPFFRFTPSWVRRKPGPGLGLTLARSLVVAMEGQLWLESRLGLGTTVHFTLPPAKP